MTDVDVVVVGAGFAGLYMAHKLASEGRTIQGFEVGSGVGGTWFWNRYPGARCDVPSLEYSYSFSPDLEQEWEWTERYATQPEILRYLEHVADRFDLRRHFRFSTPVTRVTFDDESSAWTIDAADGTTTTARFVVMATGCLSAANTPVIAGQESFAGTVLHTGQWPHEGVDLAGTRVAVIGTGSSGIQSIPLIAEQAASLTVFQRTPNYSVPAHNELLDPAVVADTKARYRDLRAANRASTGGFGGWGTPTEHGALDLDPQQQRGALDDAWALGGFSMIGAFNDITFNPAANDIAADYVRGKIRDVVTDPDTAQLLSPKTAFGCKRLCVDTGYWETFNRPNVRLVDLESTPIEEITPGGVRTTAEAFDADVLVYATGFDAMTGSLLRMDICGRGGLRLADAWAAGPETYLGLGVPGFPNMFIIAGPGSPSVLTNMVTSIEQHVEWISDCIADLEASKHGTIEAAKPAAEDWVRYVNSIAAMTLFVTCNSWYLGANVPGKPRVFMPLFGFAPYAAQCAGVAADGYRGFVLA